MSALFDLAEGALTGFPFGVLVHKHLPRRKAAMTIMPPDPIQIHAIGLPQHLCPGCGAEGIARSRLACRGCWYRLPAAIRAKVWAGYRAGYHSPQHLDALGEASRWYRANPV